ncbi:MAG TPA: hypothetical protein DCG48_03975 [Rhodospirillaceae bacterium]|nr:hypothetical protein [Rhodospirillaceae bacterium]|tara:strand:+ start:6724 stop:7110 length:387 start_codon:yes stop_codon:yes gene_type:complete
MGEGMNKGLGYAVAAAIISIAITGCANTRDPNPVGLKQAGDEKLTCRDIETEYRSNTNIATNKISKNNSDDGQDILLGFLIWPGLADFKNADGTEGNALLDRNNYLREVAVQKSCDTRSWPNQPTRYD